MYAHLRLLLGRAVLDERVGLAHVPHQVVRHHVHAELHVAWFGIGLGIGLGFNRMQP